jgi:hypothetical protein
MRFRLVTCFVAVAALACHDEPSAVTEVRGVRLDLALSSANPSRGQQDTITMTVTNTGPRLVTLTGGVCEPRPYITDSRGGVVVPPGGAWPCVLSLRRLQLVPGEHFVRAFVWNTGQQVAGVYGVSAAFTSEEVTLATPEQLVRLK